MAASFDSQIEAQVDDFQQQKSSFDSTKMQHVETDVEPDDPVEECGKTAMTSADTVLTSVATSAISTATLRHLSMPTLTFDTVEFSLNECQEQEQPFSNDADQSSSENINRSNGKPSDRAGFR